MEQTDWHTQEEERFLKEIAGLLDAEVKAGHVKGIVMVAPPRALGVLRPLTPTICARRSAARSTRTS
jgi:protein required for attachment to host cells